jgi:formylmethanofuran:tetrahydromethanopterin formyltransferase
LPTNVLLPVVAKLLVLLFKEEVYDSKAPNLVAALPVNVNTLEENKFNDAVCASIEAVNAVNDAV